MRIVQVVRPSRTYIGDSVPEEYLKNLTVNAEDEVRMRMFVAYDEDECLGYAFFSPRSARADTFEFRYILVAVDYRGEGIGSILFNQATKCLAAEGVKRIEAAVPEIDEEDILPFLAVNGFEPQGTKNCLIYQAADLKNSAFYKKIKDMSLDGGDLRKAETFGDALKMNLKEKYGIYSESLGENARLLFEEEKPAGYLLLSEEDGFAIEDFCIMKEANAKTAAFRLWGYATDRIARLAKSEEDEVRIVLRSETNMTAVRALFGLPKKLEEQKYFSKTIGR